MGGKILVNGGLALEMREEKQGGVERTMKFSPETEVGRKKV